MVVLFLQGMLPTLQIRILSYYGSAKQSRLEYTTCYNYLD